MVRKQSAPIRTTPRAGSAKLEPSPCVEALPSRAVIHHEDEPERDADAEREDARVDARRTGEHRHARRHEAADAPAAVQEDMIGGPGRVRRRCRGVIETSIAPLTAPKANRIAPSATGVGANSGSGSIRQ